MTTTAATAMQTAQCTYNEQTRRVKPITTRWCVCRRRQESSGSHLVEAARCFEVAIATAESPTAIDEARELLSLALLKVGDEDGAVRVLNVFGGELDRNLPSGPSATPASSSSSSSPSPSSSSSSSFSSSSSANAVYTTALVAAAKLARNAAAGTVSLNVRDRPIRDVLDLCVLFCLCARSLACNLFVWDHTHLVVGTSSGVRRTIHVSRKHSIDRSPFCCILTFAR